MFLSTNPVLPAQAIDSLILGRNKEHIMSLVALINEVMQRLAGVMRIIAVDSDPSAIVDVLLKNLSSRQPASIRLCTMLDKPERREVDVEVDYQGFRIPDEFVIGYGLDYDQRYRNLPYIGVLSLTEE